jgi:hypothetical protein
MAVVLALLGASVSLALAGPAAAGAATPQSGSASKAPPSGMCPVTATTNAFLHDDGWQTEGRVHTEAHIGPNQYWFVGCRYNVTVRLFGVNPWTGVEGQMSSFTHQAVAGSKWDPWGNEKWPSWDDSFPAAYARALTRVDVDLDPVTN